MQKDKKTSFPKEWVESRLEYTRIEQNNDQSRIMCKIEFRSSFNEADLHSTKVSRAADKIRWQMVFSISI